MSFLADLIAKGQSILDAKAPNPTQVHAVMNNRFDRQEWADLLDGSTKLQDVQAEIAQDADHATDLMQDLYSTFYKMEPVIADRDEMEPGHRTNRDLIDEVLRMPEVRALRDYSAGDSYAAAVAVTDMSETVGKALTTVHKAQADAKERAQEAHERAEERRKALEEAMEQAQEAVDAADGQEPPESPPEANKALEELLSDIFDGLAQAQADGEQAQQDAQGDAALAISGTRNAIRAAAKKAAEAVEDEQSLMYAFGIEEGDLKKMSVTERFELTKQLSQSRLAEFAKLLGQFKHVQKAQSRKRVINASSEVHGVRYSNDLPRMVTSEYLNFADPSLETLMLARFAENQLLTDDVRGKENLGQGPIIYVCDESGSMDARDVAGGTREAWSKALALAMLDQARRRKRDFVYIGFSSAHEQHVIRFPKGQGPLTDVLKMTEHFFDGGTDFAVPLRMALGIVGEYDSVRLNRPDIVMVTDGCASALPTDFMQEWLAVKDKLSLKCYGIAIGASSTGALAQISDNVREITQLTSDPQSVGDLFRTI